MPVSDEWAHEIKWDGIRAIVAGDGTIRTRNGNRVEGGYPELASVVHGEIVALDESGRPSFQSLQSRMHVRRPSADLLEATPVTLMVFDLLHLGGPMIDRPWEERRAALEVVHFTGPVVLSDVHDDGSGLAAAVAEHDLEGVVSKRRRSTYRPGRRSDDWRKVVNRKSCEVVVIGSLTGAGSRSSTFASLVLGLWLDDGRLRYVGSVGSGFDHSSLVAVDAALGEMQTDGPPPMEDVSVVPTPVRWVAPALVAVVEYASWTADDRLRAPVFKGFSATPVDEVTWDREGPTR